MSIVVYNGLMGSGKTYQVVSTVIVDAIAKGRNVVTNIDGINPEAIAEYCVEVKGAELSKLGSIRTVSNEDVSLPNFFPVTEADLLRFDIADWIPRPAFSYYLKSYRASHGKDLGKQGYQLMVRHLNALREADIDVSSCLVMAAVREMKTFEYSFFHDQPKGIEFCEVPETENSIVQPGDMVCIDEAWRFWGTDAAISPQDREFFRYHRHYTHPETNVSCDLCLMVQDINDLHRALKVVVELSFRTTKMKMLGLNSTYRIEMWEGYKQTPKTRASVENKNYDKRVFPMYKSYAAGKGKEVAVDSRQNILLDKRLWAIAALTVLAVLWAGSHLYNWYAKSQKPAQASVSVNSQVKADAATGAPGAPSVPSAYVAPAKPALADVSEYRSAGRVVGLNGPVEVLSNGSALRFDHASNYQGAGVYRFGVYEGKRVLVSPGFAAPSPTSNALPVSGAAK